MKKAVGFGNLGNQEDDSIMYEVSEFKGCVFDGEVKEFNTTVATETDESFPEPITGKLFVCLAVSTNEIKMVFV